MRSNEPAGKSTRELTGVATVTAIAGGCAFQVDLRFGDDYEEVRILAFDDRSSAWQLVVVDSEHGNIVVMRGHSGIASGYGTPWRLLQEVTYTRSP